ncbi:MAG: flagellar biogenesis protein [Erythrobacter sp.]|nr:flagellar biogenesis protein [Erythrobacter sp.]
MAEYILRLALLLPLLGGLIWGSLWLTRYLQTRLAGTAGRSGGRSGGRAGGRHLQLVETSLIAPGMKLAVVRFHDRDILLGLSRQGVVRLGEAPATCAEPE